MATLTYWYSECLDDGDVYSIAAKTKKEAQAERVERGAERFGPVTKKTLFYKDAFDLFYWTTSEGGGRGCGSSTPN